MANKQSVSSLFKAGIITDNPILVQGMGMCPTLAVTTSVINGLGMGLATTAVLVMSNLFISMIRKFVPSSVRIPVFIVVIASFVTVVQFLLQAFLPELNKSLGLFIPLIVVNCLILGRAEGFASKNGPFLSAVDGVAMGLGFTFALGLIGAFREFLGNGSLLNFMILPESFPRTIVMILPPGAFLTLGFILAFINYSRREK